MVMFRRNSVKYLLWAVLPLVGCQARQLASTSGVSKSQELRAMLLATYQYRLADKLEDERQMQKKLATVSQGKESIFRTLLKTDPDPIVRAEAASQVAKTRQPGAATQLLEATKDENSWVPLACLYGLLDMYRSGSLDDTETKLYVRRVEELLAAGHSRLSMVLLESARALGSTVSTESLGKFLKRRGFWSLEGKQVAKILAKRGTADVKLLLSEEVQRLKAMQTELEKMQGVAMP